MTTRTIQLFPAVDLRHGQVVRLRQGDDARATVYEEDPVAILERYARAGVEWVHVVDLDAALGEPPQTGLIGRLAAAGAVRIQLGGGLRDRAGVERALALGCQRAVLGSMVARDPEAFRALATECPGGWSPPSTWRPGRCASPAGRRAPGGRSPTSAPPCVGSPARPCWSPTSSATA